MQLSVRDSAGFSLFSIDAMTSNAVEALAAYAADEPESEDRLRNLLDRTAEQLRAHDTSGMDELMLGLNAARLDRLPSEWDSLITRVVAPHPARALLHEDPFTRHAFRKPRGYPGDAALLDLIYGESPLEEEISPPGQRVYEYLLQAPASRSVRERRRILAGLIDRVASERSCPRILSLACGHLREAQDSDGIRSGAVDELVAVDQDQASLDLVMREQGIFGVRPIRASIRRVLVNPSVYGTFDLIYAAGLYDYLDDVIAQRLTSSLFSALRPGGTIVVANFAPNLRDIGYMEAMMDWKLIYRDEGSVARFAAKVPEREICNSTVTRDLHGNVVYLSLQRC